MTERTTNADKATVTLDTSFGPDYITVRVGHDMDGVRIVALELDITEDPVGGFNLADVVFHGRRRGQGLTELIALRDALNYGIAYLEAIP